ncbi:MAG: alginate lyase family protein, partial [Verrucomicrobiota bacterium]|nr:alginate lyase family protein [Verrucomicrobiota bacterium]
EAYARHAALLIRTWFVDPATRMNPKLDFAQYIPGKNEGRGTGVLEMRHLSQICDTLALLAGSPAWTRADQKAFREWTAVYFDWLTTSRNGRDEARAANNHGSWYDVQAAHLALFLGQADFAKKILTDKFKKHIENQIEPDGRQPRELARTKSFGYCLFNLEALTKLATIAENTGINAWQFQTKDGRSLRAALRYLAPYADPSKPWLKKDLVEANRSDLLPLFAEALRHGDDPEFRELLAKFGNTPKQRAARWHLLLNR